MGPARAKEMVANSTSCGSKDKPMPHFIGTAVALQKHKEDGTTA